MAVQATLSLKADMDIPNPLSLDYSLSLAPQGHGYTIPQENADSTYAGI